MGKKKIDQLPESREEWAKVYPKIQERFLAYCHAKRCSPSGAILGDYRHWIWVGFTAFRLSRQIKDIRELGDSGQPDFSAYLWEYGADLLDIEKEKENRSSIV